jgi:hypothetical protein
MVLENTMGQSNILNFQPVVPIALSEKLNLITRYIIPIVDSAGRVCRSYGRVWVSDATMSAFFSPAASKNGWIWGAGPAFLVPIGTDDLLSTRKWVSVPLRSSFDRQKVLRTVSWQTNYGQLLGMRTEVM